MLVRDDLESWVLQALRSLGGKAQIRKVAEAIWTAHKKELERSKLLYTWQYDMRWAAMKLRKKGKLKGADKSRVWELK